MNPPLPKKVLILGEYYKDIFSEKKEASNVHKKEENFDIESAFYSYSHVKTYRREGGVGLIAQILKETKIIDPDIFHNKCYLKTYSIIKKYSRYPVNRRIPCTSICNREKESCRTVDFIGIDETKIDDKSKNKNDFTTITHLYHPEYSEDKSKKNKKNIDDYEYLLINDTGNGFFSGYQKNISNLIPFFSKLCIWNTNPSHSNFETICNNFNKNSFCKELTISTNIDELRDASGQISKGLSWEKTLQETIWQLQTNLKLMPLLRAKRIIIRIGFEGAIICFKKDNDYECHLIFDSKLNEGDFNQKIDGKIKQISSIFISYLLYKIVENTEGKIENKIFIEYITESLQFIQHVLFEGYKFNDQKIDYPDVRGFHEKIVNHNKSIKNKKTEGRLDNVSNFSSIEIRDFTNLQKILNPTWSLLDYAKESHKTLGAVAKNILISGISGDLLNNSNNAAFPIYEVGELRSIDRSEIESYQSLKTILNEYINDRKTRVPLSVAAFGPPGSGKSFGITEIISNIPNANIEKIPCNLSQYSSYSELINTFQIIRDAGLSGKIPIAFFDEFDSTFENKPLGWLKFFLAPMQDGLFFCNEHTHPIGKAIFIFAGGTCYTYDDFVNNDAYKTQKGSDFASRLRGYINIIGCDPQNDDTELFKVRRALLLRSILQRKAPHLFKEGELSIDDNVIRAFVKVSTYEHGARSMQAIVEMSTLKGKKTYDPACLPHKDILKQHTDAEDFINLVSREYHLIEKMDDIKKILRSKGKITFDDSIDCKLLVKFITDTFHINKKGYKLYKQETDNKNLTKIKKPTVITEININSNNINENLKENSNIYKWLEYALSDKGFELYSI